jgi:hypothetical protein
MYYTNEEVDSLERMVQITGGESYARRSALAIGEMLENEPTLYKTFGVYWWAIKEALKKYYPKEGWFKGDYFDQLMYNRAWHGSLFRTVLAGAYYHGQHPIIASSHEWTDKNGVDAEYTLFDEDAGF